ncbi:hypothetical protein ACFLVY_00210 [Chloroflexota bacterium]
MIKSEISRILGVGLTAGLVFGLIGTLFAAPVSADLVDWGLVNTPSWEDLVIVPGSDILDYAIGGDGDVIYAVLISKASCNGVGDTDDEGPDNEVQPLALVKSTDGGVTWTDITDNVQGAANLPAEFNALLGVAVAPDDEDWVAVIGWNSPSVPSEYSVVASKDGGDNFSYTGDMEDTGAPSVFDYYYDIAVSIEVDGIHNIAVAGEVDRPGPGPEDGTVYRLEAGSWLSAAWVDTADAYDGWDNGNAMGSDAVIACDFSPNFDLDDTIICMSVDDFNDWDEGRPWLQSGIWEGGTGTWNDEAGFPNAIQLTADGDTLLTGAAARSMGFALPADYDGSDPGARAVYVYVNAFNTTTMLVGGFLMRVDNGSVSEPYGPSGEPLLYSVDFHGDADTGKMMIGEYIQWDNDAGGNGIYGESIDPGPCEGVRVWHTVELDPCCPNWELACKSPSGLIGALVMYTPDGDKAYASTTGETTDWDWKFGDIGTPLDESAFSVSLDDGVSFNQIGLIDTDIDWLSDVAVCPDCSTIYLSTINYDYSSGEGDYPCGDGDDFGGFNCDSVWRSYDNGDTWERVFHGDWADTQSDALLLRLPCDAIEDCCDQDAVAPSGTVYLGIVDGDDIANDDIFYSRDCGQCWNDPPSPKVDIQDFAVESENVVYVIDDDGYITKSTQYGRRWSDKVDTEIGSGHSITTCCEQGFVVVGGDGSGTNKVAWSDDGGETFTLTDALPSAGAGEVHVACDPTCENIIYAAVDGHGIYRTDVTSGAWDDLQAQETHYTGIVVAREGTLYAASDNIGVDSGDPCSTKFDGTGVDGYYSGVARNLTPCETACCGTEDWDYLISGLDTDPDENFDADPTSLRICGCLSIDTNSVLYAIDTDWYDVIDGAGDNDSNGGLWSYEDCAAKAGPVLTSPADGTVLDCEPCAGCDAASFTLKWERMCEACSYDVVIMDADGNTIVEWTDVDITGDPPSLFVDGTMDGDEYFLECGMNYTWKVREANTASECIHSPWSETWSFTIAVGAADAINLLAPEKGAMGTPIENIGFSWTSVRNATSYSFVLSPNANLAGALVSQDQSTTAFNFVGPLDYSKAYYWQIIAWQDGTRLTTSSIGVFNTMAKPVAPQPPVVVEQQPAPVINIPPAQQITPTWIYAIIGIGCALAVVVIVLIVRTRRP